GYKYHHALEQILLKAFLFYLGVVVYFHVLVHWFNSSLVYWYQVNCNLAIANCLPGFATAFCFRLSALAQLPASVFRLLFHLFQIVFSLKIINKVSGLLF